jgi:hypothetical protein
MKYAFIVPRLLKQTTFVLVSFLTPIALAADAGTIQERMLVSPSNDTIADT